MYDAVATVLDTAIDSQQLGQPTHYQKPALSRDSEENGSLKILLAEDNIVNQRVALRLLEKLGYRADVAVDGNGVLESLKRQSYDIVLMDVQMPEMDGLETSRQIARICRPEKKPWIIAMTANAMQGDREACFEAGMNDYLSKPVRMPALRAVLERASLKRLQVIGDRL